MKKFTTLMSALVAFGGIAAAQQPGAPARKAALCTTMPTVSIANAPEQDEPIVDTPEGTFREYARSNWYFYPAQNMAYLSPDAGYCCDIVYADDNTVYLKNPISGIVTDTWIKGTSDGYKITFQFPQPLGTFKDEKGKEHTYYLNRMKLYYGPTGIDYRPVENEDENVLVLYIENNGEELKEDCEDWDTVNGFPPYVTAVSEWSASSKSYKWAYYGDSDMLFKAYSSDQILRLPEGLKAERYEMHFMDSGSRYISICLDGDDIYMADLAEGLADCWVKGTINETRDAYIIPSGQMLGRNEEMNHILYLMGADIHYGIDEETGHLRPDYYYTTDQMVFEYDEDIREFACDKPISVNCGDFVFYPYKIYYDIIINWVDPTIKVGRPATPSMSFESYYDPDLGAGTWCFNIYNRDVDGNRLDTSRMGFNIYVDGEEYIIHSDEYRVAEDMFDIPYNFSNNWDIYFNGSMHCVNYYMTDYDYVEVVSYFDPEDGERLYSERFKWNAHGSVEGLDATEGESTYFDLQGRRVANPENGIFIKKTRMSDGSVKTSKHSIR